MELTFCTHTQAHTYTLFWLVYDYIFFLLSLNRLLVGTNDDLTLVSCVLALVHINFVHPENRVSERESARRQTGYSQNEQNVL